MLFRSLSVTYGDGRWILRHAGHPAENKTAVDDHTVQLLQHEGVDLQILLDDCNVAGSVVPDGDFTKIFCDAGRFTLRYIDPLAHAIDADSTATGGLTAPMPGKIVAILVAQGDTVAKGTPLLVMEAMKMEHTIEAPRTGKIDRLLYAVGDQVNEGAPLLSLKTT